MTFPTTLDGPIATLLIEGRFTFERHQDFKSASAPLLEIPALKEIHLDLAGVSYMDSSALGMVLLLRERAAAGKIQVVLARPSPTVMAVLKVVQFGKLFQITG